MYTIDQIYKASYRAGIELHDIFNLTRILEKIGDPPSGDQPERFEPDNLIALLRRICELENVDYEEVIGKSRESDLVRVRAAYCAIAKWFWADKITTEKIGRAVRIDHSTVVYHIRNSRDLKYRKKEFDSIRTRLNFKM